LKKGEALGIVGESGAGKTSLAMSLIRTLPSNVIEYSGEMLFKSKNLSILTDEEFRKAFAGRLFQWFFKER
jgi:peptide/nickel transport system ATP-binding protein